LEIAESAHNFRCTYKWLKASRLQSKLSRTQHNPSHLASYLLLPTCIMLKNKPPMNKLKYIAAILIAVAGLGLQQAQAHLLNPTQFTTPDPIGNPASETQFLKDNNYLPASSQFLFKQDKDGNQEGAFGQYFTITVLTASSWSITWDFLNTGLVLDGVLIKDGSEAGSHGDQLYRFYGVSADELTAGAGIVAFDNPVKGISHIGFLGSEGGNGVPDGGSTVMLLGAALGSLGMVRRFLKK